MEGFPNQKGNTKGSVLAFSHLQLSVQSYAKQVNKNARSVPMDSSGNKDLVRRQRITCVVVVAGLIVFFIFARHCSWHGSNQGHTLTELATTLIAALVGVLALVRFYSKKLNTVLFRRPP